MEHLPEEKQPLSVIIVRDSEIHVKTGVVEKRTDDQVFLQLFDKIEAPIKNVTGKLITLIYGTEDQIFRLKSRIAEVISEERIAVEIVGEAKKRERREFLRVEAKLPIKLCKLGSSNDDDALDEADTLEIESIAWDDRNVNLSGSGIRFISDDSDPSEYYLVQLVLPFRNQAPVSIVGRVARVDQLPDGSTAIAVHFVNVSVSAQDMIINYVFKRQYELIEEKFKEA